MPYGNNYQIPTANEMRRGDKDIKAEGLQSSNPNPYTRKALTFHNISFHYCTRFLELWVLFMLANYFAIFFQNFHSFLTKRGLGNKMKIVAM